MKALVIVFGMLAAPHCQGGTCNLPVVRSAPRIVRAVAHPVRTVKKVRHRKSRRILRRNRR